MAQRIEFVSDYNADTDTENVESTEYRVNGVTYVADLGDEGRAAVEAAQAKAAEILRKAEAQVDKVMADFVKMGAEVKPVKATRTPRTGDDRAASLRVWLKDNPQLAQQLADKGYPVAERGRINEGVWERATVLGWKPTAPAAI